MSTFKVEDGTGMTDATSYVSLVEADNYMADTPPSLTLLWAPLADADKERLLMYATRVLDQRTTWKGLKVVNASSLRWPRSGVRDCDGLPVAENVVPRYVKSVVCELALFYANPNNGASVVADIDGLKRVTVDVLEFEWKDNYNPNTTVQLPPGLNKILCNVGIIKYSGRMGFAPINRV